MNTDPRELDRRAVEFRETARDLRKQANSSASSKVDALLCQSQADVVDRIAAMTEDEARKAHRGEHDEARRIVEHGSSLSVSTHDQDAQAFRDYIRTGSTAGLYPADGESRTALNAGTGANGGYYVPEPLHAPLIEKYRKLDPISTLATHVDMSGSVSMYLPYKATHGVAVTTTETGARTEQTEPTLTGGASTALTAWDYYTDQRATQTWLDSTPQAEDIMMGWVYGDIAEQFGVDVAVGDGSNKAAGLFAATAFYTTALSGAAAAISNTGIQAIYTTLQPMYWQDAVWLMNSATLGVAMGFAMPNLNNTPMVTFNGEGDPYIMGKRVYISSSAPAIGAANYPIAFGDVSQGFITGTHRQTAILRDPYTAAPNVRLYGLCRKGGRPWNPNAMVLLKSNNS